ncbi:MAG: alpha/beta fold hydrolase [Gemmatimonadota bacterium]
MPTVDLSGVTTQYELTGTGEPLVFIHGLGGRGGDWAPQVAHFQGRYRVLTYDVIGHGESAKPAAPYTLAQFGRQAAELIRRVIGGPAHIVGLSMGGMIAFQLAVDAPDLVRSLTIVNSGPELVPRTWQERYALWMRVFILRVWGLEKLGRIIAERLFPSPAQHALKTRFLAEFLRNDRWAYLAATRALIGWSVQSRIGAITVPALVVASDQDYTPPSRKEEYVRLMRHAKLVVVPDARHALPIENPAKFNAVLDPFLAELASA